jgi:hypothetical protein
LLAPVGRADVAFGIAGAGFAAADLPAVLAGADFTAAVFAADFVGAAFAAAAGFTGVAFAAGLAEIDLAAAGFAEVLPAGLDAAALAAGSLDVADFAAGFAGADFAGAGFAADLAVDFVAGFDAAGFEILAAAGFAVVLFASAAAGLAVAFACLAGAALTGFVGPVFVGVAGLDDAPAGFAFGAAVLFVVLANCASLVFRRRILSSAAAPLAAVCSPGKCRQIEPKAIVPTMYCDNAAARKPCLCVNFGIIFLVERRLNSRSQVSLSPQRK